MFLSIFFAKYTTLFQKLSNFITSGQLWDDTGNYVDDNTLSVYIRRLREKIEIDASHPQHLITVRGFGYKWKEVEV